MTRIGGGESKFLRVIPRASTRRGDTRTTGDQPQSRITSRRSVEEATGRLRTDKDSASNVTTRKRREKNEPQLLRYAECGHAARISLSHRAKSARREPMRA